MLSKHTIARSIKKLIYPNGEAYMFKNIKLFFEVGSRPVRRKYLSSENGIVRNDVLQIEFFEKNFGPHDVLWDIGSHHGHFSIFAALLSENENQVFSFEPDKDAKRIQERNIRLNNLQDKIIVFDWAVSNVDGNIRFSSQGGNSNSHLVKNNSNPKNANIISVHSSTMNSLLNEISKPSFVKIDTEGAEIDILSEASDLLNDPSIKFICELHPFAWKAMNVNYHDFLSILKRYNRTISTLDPDKKVEDLPYYGSVLF